MESLKNLGWTVLIVTVVFYGFLFIVTRETTQLVCGNIKNMTLNSAASLQLEIESRKDSIRTLK